MHDQPFVVVAMLPTPFAFRFTTEKAASAVAEFLSHRGAAIVVEDRHSWGPHPQQTDAGPATHTRC